MRLTGLHSAGPTLRRRDILFAGAAAALGTACTRTEPRAPSRTTGARGSVEVWSHFDLSPDDPRSRELSGAAWDAKERILWAVQDETPTIVPLLPDPDVRRWKFGDAIELETRGPVDLEGIVVLPDGFIVSSEEGPRVIEVDRKGRYVRDIPLPPRLREARHNLSLESLTLSPNGRYLFTTTESALEHDGEVATQTAGARVRFLRVDRSTGALTEHVYLTDPEQFEGSGVGISDFTALDEDRLLVLERGWSPRHGNTIRIYETALDARAACTGVERLSASSTALEKRLRVDLSDLSASGFPAAKQPQSTPLLDNYEGMTLGPSLKNGRPSLILVSDDNAHADQFSRILVLAI